MELKTWLRAQWDRVLGAAAVIVGLLALLLGYQGIADTPFPAEQIPYVISGGVLGVCLVGIGLTAWLSADLRDEWHKLDRLERLLEDTEEPVTTADDVPARHAASPASLESSGSASDAPEAVVAGRSNGHRSQPIAAPGSRS